MVYGLHLNFWPVICKGSPASMDAFAHDVSHLTLFFCLGGKSKSCNFSNIICIIVLFSLYPLFCYFFFVYCTKSTS